MRVRYLVPFEYTAFGSELLGGGDETPMAPPPALDPTVERREHAGASAFTTIVAQLPLEGTELEGHLLVGRLGIAAAVVDADVADLHDIAPTEARTLEHLSARLTAWQAASCAAAAVSASPADPQVLWVHRVVILPPTANFTEPMVPLDYGVDVALSRGARAVVGSGYSALWSSDHDHVEAVTQGLFVATQAWVAYDALSEQSVRLLDEVVGGRAVDDPAVLALTARRLRAFVHRLQSGLVDGRAATYRAAAAAWGITDEHESLIERADAYVEFVKLRASDRQSRVDRRRNMLLFGLAFTALSQTVVAIHAGITSRASGWGSAASVATSVVAGAVAMVGVAVGLVWAIGDKRDQDGSLFG